MDENMLDRELHRKNQLRNELEIQVIRQERELEETQRRLDDLQKELHELQQQKSLSSTREF